MKATNVLTGLLSSQNPYLKPLPANLKNKLIVVIGDKDNVVTKKAIGMMRHQAPMAKFKIVHGVGHILHFEAINDLVIRDS
jgi:pimeloyl-ACP methyl ester carboxylesterase